MQLAPIGVALVCTLSVIIMFAGVARFLFGSSAISQRLDRFGTRAGADNGASKDKSRLTDELDKELVRRGRSSDLALQLARRRPLLHPNRLNRQS